jgi:glc operon protein GlcG
MSSITYSEAQALVNSGISSALSKHQTISVAVTDAHGEVVAFGRMDGAALHSGVLAQSKAYTSARDRQPTSSLGKWARETGKDLGYWADSKMTGMGGGLPIEKGAVVIGGMGVSGLSEEGDEDTVRNALKECGY